ncbi:type II toxin-antitoxin system RelE/ParE family toxin [bacterium]|nr:type II toxin-antitoxin system RelE/ParE family toxin [bacterium]
MSEEVKEYIAYEGDAFTIEWYYDENGKSDVLEYYKNLSDTRRRKLLLLIKRMGDAGRIFDETKFRNEGEKIFAFKPQPDRYLCFFFEGKKIILTNAFQKKTRKLPKREKERALKIKKEYSDRVKRGEYYDS